MVNHKTEKIYTEKTSSEYMKFGLFLLVSLFLIGFGSASLLNPGQTGANSQNYSTNYISLIDGFFTQPGQNVTQVFNNGTADLMWVPWYSSSNQCGIAQLKPLSSCGSSGSSTMTNNCQISDEFSELCLGASLSNNQTRFQQCFNTYTATRSSFGVLPSWNVRRSGTTVSLGSTDSATDTSVKIGLSLYNAANNTLFTNETQKAAYLALANQMAQDHVTYETKKQLITNTGIGDGVVNYWLASGANTGVNGNLQFSDPFIYTAYYPEAINFMIAAYHATGNATYLNVSDDYVEQDLLSKNYTGGISASSFKVAPYNFQWNVTNGGKPRVRSYTEQLNASGGNTSVSAYYILAGDIQWDDSDAPRNYRMCDTLRVMNLAGANTSNAYLNLSTYCQAWNNAPGVSGLSGQSALQYFYNGSYQANSIGSGFWNNGLGAMASTVFNTSIYQTKVDSAIGKFDYVNKYYDPPCYGVYRGIAPARALAAGLGLNDVIYSGSPPPLPPPGIIITQNAITITLQAPTNGSTSYSLNQSLSVLIDNLNFTTTNNPFNDTTPKLYYNFTALGLSSFTGGFTTVGSYLNMTGNINSAPSANLSKYNVIRTIFYGNLGSGISATSDTMKFYPQTTSSGQTGNIAYFENNTGSTFNLKVQAQVFTTVSSTIPRYSNYTLIIDQNQTDRTIRVNITAANLTATVRAQSAWLAGSTAGNNSMIAGNNYTAITIPSDYPRAYSGDLYLFGEEVWNIGTPVSNDNFTYGNSNVTVKFYNNLHTLLGTVTNVLSGSIANITTTYASVGNKSWYVNVTTEGTGANATTYPNLYGFSILNSPDVTPPTGVSNLGVYAYNQTFITWNWTNPSTPDFNDSLIYIDGNFVASTSATTYNLTGLSPSTSHTIDINTRDSSGNINTTNVSNTATTQATPIIPPYPGQTNGLCVAFTNGIPGFFGALTPFFGILAIAIIVGILFIVVASLNKDSQIDYTKIDTIFETFDIRVAFLLILGLGIFGFIMIAIFGVLCAVG